MQKYKQEFREFMVKSNVLRFGEFVTKSGRQTPFFINTGNYTTGEQLEKLGEFYAQTIKERIGTEVDVLFGPAYKGFPLTVTTAIAMNKLYGTNVEYALYVNDGHVQHKRFLPAERLSANGKSVYLKKKDQKGIMLSERYIQGKFFLEKGAQSAKPRIERACDSWLRDTFREAIGALL